MIANLLVDLDERRFGSAAMRSAVIENAAAGYMLKNLEIVDERHLSWLDAAFDGTWSSEVAAGSAWFASRGSSPVGVAGYGAAGLRFFWLQKWERERDVGIFGPFGLVSEHRSRPLARALAIAGLSSLRERGFRRALIPAVTPGSIIMALERDIGAQVVEELSLERTGTPLRTTVLASGGGTNFQAVIDALPDGLGLELVALVTNKPGAGAVERARAAGITSYVVPWDRANISRDDYDDGLIEVIARTEPDLVLLLGWMHLLPPRFLQRFGAAINIHPAFLPYDTRAETVTMPDGLTIPAFRGAHAIKDALAAGSPWYGATAHRLSVEPDRGAILRRAPLPLVARDEESALAALRPTEHAVLLGAIRRVLAERTP